VSGPPPTQTPPAEHLSFTVQGSPSLQVAFVFAVTVQELVPLHARVLH